MSDIEEPPTKMSKYEMSQTFTQLEEMEEGQEEWLSEDLLTDDDGNPATAEQDLSDSALGNTSQISNSQDNTNPTYQDSSNKVEDSNIEQTLNNMNNQEQEDLPDDLDTFLIRKTDMKVKPKPEEETDGNDTDDLLRMLEDDDKTKKKKTTKTYAGARQQKQPAAPSSDEEDRDDYDVFEGASIKKIVAKSVLMRKLPASKAVPEDSSDETDAQSSNEEVVTMKKMFGVRKAGNFAAKSTSKRQGQPIVTKQLVKVTDRTGQRVSQRSVERRHTSTPIKQYTRVAQNKSLLKPSQNGTPIPKPDAKCSPVHKPVDKAVDKPVAKPVERLVNKNMKKVVVSIPEKEQKNVIKNKQEHDEIINEEEFLEEDDFDLDEDFAAESDMDLDRRASTQRLMEPERFDEEMLSDGESLSDDGSLYDELPSSDSEDLDDWFALDIRTERAGDYLPLLGAQAYELLLEEKKRVSARLNTLRESIASLSDNGRLQSHKLKVATAKLADVDDTLKAS